MKIRNLRSALVFAAAFVAVSTLITACGELTGPVSPSTPSNVTATLASPVSATVTWTPSPKNDGVISYSIYRNGVKVGESTTTTFTDTGLAQQTTYVYSVAANCKSGVISDRSAETAQSTVTTVDITPPTVIANQPPTNFNGASPAATATVTFSEPMDPNTINTTTFNLRVTGGATIAGTVTYTAATRIAEFRPTSALPNPANITATVTTGAKDLAGNAMAAQFNWSFTTRDETPPTVTAVVPAAGAVGVNPNTTVQITFSENMDATTITTANVTLKTTIGGTAVAGAVAYNATTKVATFTPSAALAQLTGYTVTVSGVKDAAGNAIAAAFTSAFTTGDTNPPTVVSVVPANAATGVSVTSNVKVTFSEAMDATTINASSITVTETIGGAPVTGVVTYDAATTSATFTPAANLSSFTGYTVTVTTGVKDAAGNAMASQFTSTFTTVLIDNTPPTVTSVVPANGTIGVATSTAVQITFSEAMDASTINGTTVTLRTTSPSAAVAATVGYNTSTHVATITPNAPLAINTNYTVGVSTGVKDAAGNAMASAFSSTFTTINPDVTPPTVVGVVPTSGATNVATNAAVNVTFSEAMDQSTITTSTITLKNTSTSAAVTGTIGYNVGTNTATFTPSGPLSNNTNYTLTVSTGVKDLSGNAMASTFTSAFTTVPVADVTPPTVVSRTPANASTNQAINTNITVTFSEPMDAATITTSTITVAPTSTPGSPVAVSISYDAGTNTATLNPTVDLDNNTSYTITVTTGVKDVAGNALASTSTSTFTTVADTTPPIITGTTPTNGAVNVAPVGAVVTVTFNEAMDLSTINNTNITLKTTAGSVLVTAIVSYNAPTRTATLTPSGNLAAATGYTITVSGVKDVAGNAMLGTSTYTFTTQ